jgi:hypothetical protein
VRRWCVFEWFYSAIDYPWFSKREFVEYLEHVRLGHIPRLTRVEWGVIRRSVASNFFSVLAFDTFLWHILEVLAREFDLHHLINAVPLVNHEDFQSNF